MMHNFWLVAKRTYLNTVVRRGFVVATLAVPLGLAALVGLGIFVSSLGESRLAVGYVDQAGVLDTAVAAPAGNSRVEIRAFPDEEAGLETLRAEEIQALFVLPPGYPQTLETDLFYLERPPSGDAWRTFDDFIRANLVADVPPAVAKRLLHGPSVIVTDLASGREFSQAGIANIILPFAASFLFFFATMMASGTMLEVVAEEKDNRTMEIMMTSLTPGQLIGGKTLGLLAAALTQLAIYAVSAVVGLSLAAAHVPEIQQVQVPWGYLGIMALFFFPAYGLVAAIMIAIGSGVGEMQQGQQVAGLLSIAFTVPLFVLPVIFDNPGHPLAVALTLFPTTSFLTISLRWGLGSVPAWQIGLGWVILVASGLAMVWVAARIFRTSMLRYGQPLSWKALVAALRE